MAEAGSRNHALLVGIILEYQHVAAGNKVLFFGDPQIGVDLVVAGDFFVGQIIDQSAGIIHRADKEFVVVDRALPAIVDGRSEEHTSELQSLMRISYAVFCLKKKKKTASLTTEQRYNQRITHRCHKH